jgi:hypothetical protein
MNIALAPSSVDLRRRTMNIERRNRYMNHQRWRSFFQRGVRSRQRRSLNIERWGPIRQEVRGFRVWAGWPEKAGRYDRARVHSLSMERQLAAKTCRWDESRQRQVNARCRRGRSCSRKAGYGRVRVWRGGLRCGLSVPAPFVWRCLTSRTITPFPHPSHRTGHAELPHPALGQDPCLRTRKVTDRPPAHRTGPCYPGEQRRGRAADNRERHRLGGRSLPGTIAGFFLRFSM